MTKAFVQIKDCKRLLNQLQRGKIMSRMKTTGDLRQFLADSIMAVKNWPRWIPKSRGTSPRWLRRLRSRSTAEVKVAKTMKELGRSVKGLGDSDWQR